MAGGLAVVLVYLHGRLWRGAGFGLTAAILVGFNQSLLLRMQEATPATLVLCGVLASLLGYGWHERVTAESGRPWWWAGPVIWAVIGGLALGLALLALGGSGIDHHSDRALAPMLSAKRPDVLVTASRKAFLVWLATRARASSTACWRCRCNGRIIAVVRVDGRGTRLGRRESL